MKQQSLLTSYVSVDSCAINCQKSHADQGIMQYSTCQLAAGHQELTQYGSANMWRHTVSYLNRHIPISGLIMLPHVHKNGLSNSACMGQCNSSGLEDTCIHMCISVLALALGKILTPTDQLIRTNTTPCLFCGCTHASRLFAHYRYPQQQKTTDSLGTDTSFQSPVSVLLPRSPYRALPSHCDPDKLSSADVCSSNIQTNCSPPSSSTNNMRESTHKQHTDTKHGSALLQTLNISST